METVINTIRKIDLLLILAPCILGIFSIVMIRSIASEMGGASNMVATQTLAFILGAAAMIGAAFIDTGFLYRLKWQMYALCFILQLTIYIPGLGVEVGGQRAWINLGFTTLQPSEFIKIAFILFFAAWLHQNREILFTFKGFLKSAVVAFPVVALVAYIDMGAGIVVFIIFVGMVFAAGLRGRLFGELAAVFILAIPIMYRFLAPHQKRRFDAFLHPSNTEIDETYQLLESKVAIGSGGLFGKGLGNGTIKESGFLPVQESDFIFAVLCEEMGLVGGLAVLLVYGILLFRIWRTASRAHEAFGALVCVGFLCMFGFQMFENIAMTMGLMPITGITLPFLSAGGTSVMANMMGIGLILGICVRSKTKTYKHISSEPAIMQQ